MIDHDLQTWMCVAQMSRCGTIDQHDVDKFPLAFRQTGQYASKKITPAWDSAWCGVTCDKEVRKSCQ
jgi:hypothetical protein